MTTHVRACGFLALVVLLVFGDVVLFGGGRIVSHADDDLAKIFLAWQRFGFGELRRGNLALWNPHVYAGTPFLGGFQAGLLYPPSWLHLIFAPALANNLFVAAHVLIAGVGVYAWTTHHRLHPTACTLAGCVYMLGGAYFLQVYRGHLPNLATVAWVPLVFLAIDGILATCALRWVGLGMAAIALQILAGHVQYLLYTAIIAALYALPRLWRSAHRAHDGGALVAVYVGAALLAAVQLFTGLDAVAESLRTGLRFEVARTFAFPPENLATLVVPGLFGDMVRTPYWGRWTLSETSIFIGVAPTLLALFGAVHGDRRVVRRSLALIVVSLVLAFGDSTPLFRVLYDSVPGFASFRGLAKFTPLAMLFTALLVALGVDAGLRRGSFPRWLGVTAALAALVLLGLGAALLLDGTRHEAAGWQRLLARVDFTAQGFRYFVAGRAPTSVAACINAGASLAIAGSAFAVASALMLAARRAPALSAVVLCGIVELVVHARYFRPTFDPAPIRAAEDAVRAALVSAGALDGRVLGPSRRPYLALGAGLDDVWGAEPMILARYARFVAATQGTEPDGILTTPALRTLSPWLGWLRLRHQIRVDDARAALVPTGLRELPRALLVPRWRVLDSPAAVLTAMTAPDFDPSAVALLEHDPGLATGASAGVRGSVRVADLSTDALEIHVDTPNPVVLLLSDNYASGWKVTALDDAAKRYAVLPADYTLRAIPLPAGTHHLRLDYRPTAFLVGAWTSALSMIACALAFLLRGRSSAWRA